MHHLSFWPFNYILICIAKNSIIFLLFQMTKFVPWNFKCSPRYFKIPVGHACQIRLRWPSLVNSKDHLHFLFLSLSHFYASLLFYPNSSSFFSFTNYTQPPPCTLFLHGSYLFLIKKWQINFLDYTQLSSSSVCFLFLSLLHSHQSQGFMDTHQHEW